MRMLIRRASASSNIIDTPISEYGEYEENQRTLVDTFNLLQSMFKGGSSSYYRDQIYTITQWFGQWSDCEQTVALYTLLRQLDCKQARFIEHLLQEQAAADPNVDGQENQANSLDFVQKFNLSSKLHDEELLPLLLKYFPLLHPGNENVKNEYIKAIPKVLSRCVENGDRVEDCRKLLTYTLIHPAVSNDERALFTKWLGQLERQCCMKTTQTNSNNTNVRQASTNLVQTEEQQANCTASRHTLHEVSKDSGISASDLVFTDVEVANRHHPLQVTSSAPSCSNSHKKLTRTASWKVRGDSTSTNLSGGSFSPSAGHWRSLTPPRNVNVTTDWVINASNRVTENVSPAHSDHAPLSPQSSISSTDSDHESKSSVLYQHNSGMKEFPAWLKGLRLHKYCPLFMNVSYEDMLKVDEKWLEDKKVTKGARNKIVHSISKLRERAADLKVMEKCVMQGANLQQILTDLKNIVHSPIKPYVSQDESIQDSLTTPNDVSDDDLACLINRIMGRLCTQLLVNSRVEEECYPNYISLIDKCMHHEAFTVKQRKLLQEWRSQVLQRNNGRMITGRQEQRLPLHRPSSRTNSWNPVTRRASNKGIYAQRAIQAAQGQWYGAYEKKALTLTYSGPEHLSVPQTYHSTAKAQQGVKSAIHRTQSAPIRAHASCKRAVSTSCTKSIDEPEINERLDSLARSMTEAALSSQGDCTAAEHGDGDVKVTSCE